jgi:spore germination protein YaaH
VGSPSTSFGTEEHGKTLFVPADYELYELNKLSAPASVLPRFSVPKKNTARGEGHTKKTPPLQTFPPNCLVVPIILSIFAARQHIKVEYNGFSENKTEQSHT